MSMKYIRDRYGVPAKRGGRVCYTEYDSGKEMYGTITSTMGAHLCIRFDGNKHTGLFHPTYNLIYLDEEQPTCDKNTQVEESMKEADHA